MMTCEWGYCTKPATAIHTILFVGDGHTSTRRYCPECSRLHADHCKRIAAQPGHKYVLIAGELGSEALLAIEVMCHAFASFARES